MVLRSPAVLRVGLATVALLATPAASHAQDEIAERLAASRERADELRWRSLDWHTSPTAALAEARRVDKPVFLFGYDGELDSGNC